MNASVLRFSLARLLAAVVLIAAALGMLVGATPFWADLCSVLVTLLFLIAIVAIPYRCGAARAFWIGFAVLGWGYVLERTSWLGAEVAFSHVLEPLHKRIRRFEPPTEDDTTNVLFTSEKTVQVDGREVPIARMRTTLTQARERSGKQRVAVYIDPSVDSNALLAPLRTLANNANSPVVKVTPAFPAPADFFLVGQRLCALLFALVGGLAGRLLYATRNKQAAPAPPNP